MKKWLCKLGLHKWVTFYRTGIVYRHPVSRRCRRCLKKQEWDHIARRFKEEGFAEREEKEAIEALKFINNKPNGV